MLELPLDERLLGVDDGAGDGALKRSGRAEELNDGSLTVVLGLEKSEFVFL